MSLKRRLVLAALLAVAVLLMSPLLVFARAGGGSHFGGGGGGGFGGGSSFGGGGGYYHGGYSGGYGGGGSGLGFLFPLLFFGGGSGGFFVFIVILFALYQFWRRTSLSTPARATAWGPSYAPMADLRPSSVADGLSGLQAKDPNFNQQMFLDRAQAAFFALQKAWMDRNLEPARVYMSDAIYQRWKDQVDSMIAAHKRNILEDLVIGGAQIVKVQSDPNFDSITVRIDASAADYEVDDRDASKVVFGSRQSQPFTEYWTFIRSGAARTKAGEAPAITQCPNCGAPLSINASGVCSYCKAVVTSGQFGWVLDNITQASEWQG